MNGTTLEVTGDDRSDELAIRLDATGTLIVLDVNDDGTAEFAFDRSTFTTISVSAGGGGDVVRIDETLGAFTEKSIVIDGGPGRDTLTGGSGDDVLIGGDDDDVVEGRRGNDTILLGAGDDIAVWHPGDGSDVIEGQEGTDRLVFNGANISENFDLSANGARVRMTRDIASIVMDLNGVEELDLGTLGGADVVTVDDITGTDLVNVNVDLAGTPGGGDGAADSIVLLGTPGADTVSVSATDDVLEVDGLSATVRVLHAEPALDRVNFVALGADEVHVLGTSKPDTMTITPSPVAGAMRASVDSFPAAVDVSNGGTLMVLGLGGGDTITGSNGLAALPTALVIDGGPGDDVITGGDGADTLIGGPGSDIVIGGRGNDLLLLGPGADVAVWRPGDGSDTIEGQDGSDTLDFETANINENIEISANGPRVRLTRDVASIVQDINGVEQIDVTPLGGADRIVVDDLQGTGVKGVTVDLAAIRGTGTGDSAIDTVVVNGTDDVDRMRVGVDRHGVVTVRRKGGKVRIENPEPTDNLVVNGLGGVDKLHASRTVPTAITLTINQD